MKNKTVLRIVRILNFIAKNPQGVTFTEIVAELELPKSTVYDILQALYDTECVYYKDERIKSYAIGSTIFSLGRSYSTMSTFINLSNLYIKDVSESIGQPVLVSKFAIDRVVYVNKYEPEDNIIKTPELDVGDEGIDSSVGKLFVALTDYNQDELTELCSGNTQYLKELTKIRKDRCIIEYNTKGKHSVVIAVPAFNFEGKICGVISTIGIHIPGQIYTETLSELQEMAMNISQKLRYDINKFQ